MWGLLTGLAAAWLTACPGNPTPTGGALVPAREIIEGAQAAISAGRAGDAASSLRELVDRAPEDALARATLAHALLLLGDVEGSLVQGKLAVGLDVHLASASWNLACAYARLKDRDASVAWLQRAVRAGGYGPSDLRDDPDFASIIEDHRIAVFLASGVLSRTEEDVIVQLDRDRTEVGVPVVLSIALVQLNRAPLSVSTAQLALGRDVGLRRFDVTSRRETFSRGEAGGREYVQRTVHFELVPLASGPHVLGPFEITGEDGVHWTSPVMLFVEGEAEGTTSQDSLDFFGFPSVKDEAVIKELVGDRLRLWEVGELPEWSTELPRALRFRLPILDGELNLPPPIDGARRSVFLRRSTEGFSWVLDQPAVR